MPVYYEWKSLKIQKSIKLTHKSPRFEVSNHPLKANIMTMRESSSVSFMDHLNKWSAGFEEIDPLLKFERMELEEDFQPGSVGKVDDFVTYSKAWSMKRTKILNKYTTGEKLTIVSSFLPGGEKALIRQVSNLNEKVKNRLEQLDDFDEDSVRKTMGLSQQEFVIKINMLNDEIRKAWDSEQRVKAFKICIQCSKMLCDVNVMQFYPSKFILITDILDTFGNLVFQRLKEKSFGNIDIKNAFDVDPKQVPEVAKETCQNWMFKMASIRELLPRLYMELALLKCYIFISKEDVKPALARLTTMIRGIGIPLVSVYLRLYLCHVASKLLGNDSESYFNDNLKEFLDEYHQIFHPMMRKKYETQLLTLDKYLSLYTPAVDWLLYGTLNNTKKCNDTLLAKLLERCSEIENNELLLCCMLNEFDSASIIQNASTILEIIQSSAENMVMLNDTLYSLGEHLCTADNYRLVASEALIQTWWKITNNLKSTVSFLQVLEPWLHFACTHLSTQHVNIILRGTIRYMIKCDKYPDEHYGHFQSVVKRMLKAIPDVEELFLMDAFMPLLELVHTSNARTLLAKTVLSIFFSRYNGVAIEDHIVISSLMRLCCTLHDSINAVTVEDEIKLCSDLINRFVQVISYQNDLEEQLNFYVDCRSSFIKLDAVLVTLVHCVNALAARATGVKSKWLQRACVAYCFITVPSLRCTLAKAHLYLLSGQVALLNNCIGQAEANFKALIGLIPDIPEFIMEDGQKKPTNVKVSGILSDFLSTLLILPDNLDSNCKAYILSGLIKTMDRIHWKKTDSLYYTTMLQILDLLCAMTQENYAYNIDAVLSNDKLYGCDVDFIEYIEKYATSICQDLLVVLKTLGDNKETKKQYNLALELFWRVIRRGDLQERLMFSLAANLWMLSQKLQDSNNKIAKAIMTVLQQDSRPISQQLLKKLEEGVKN
ncbi:hypothetical protein K1T71_003937 [Dendrolimus kikuchii]|uniref:Uncharacterized protein n=1 Tax=Dendrolimus kikuchii TaxID=765133 RepID=A0ACC1D9B0_9NEOP|nr:hypothetical protein K1T71_003937 [Dendrolimus kikuchii]